MRGNPLPCVLQCRSAPYSTTTPLSNSDTTVQYSCSTMEQGISCVSRANTGWQQSVQRSHTQPHGDTYIRTCNAHHIRMHTYVHTCTHAHIQTHTHVLWVPLVIYHRNWTILKTRMAGFVSYRRLAYLLSVTLPLDNHASQHTSYATIHATLHWSCTVHAFYAWRSLRWARWCAALRKWLCWWLRDTCKIGHLGRVNKDAI